MGGTTTLMLIDARRVMLKIVSSPHIRSDAVPREPRRTGSSALRFAALSFLALGIGGLAACSGSSQPGIAGDAGMDGDAAERPECHPSVVLCRSLPPACPAGEVPAISGTCWAGHCVKASACRNVKDCTACSGDQYVCANDFTRGFSRVRCVDVPAVCADDRTCACLQSYICTEGLGHCLGLANEFMCECPNC